MRFEGMEQLESASTKRYVINDTLTNAYHDNKRQYTFEGVQEFLRSLYELDIDMFGLIEGVNYRVPNNVEDLNKELNHYCYELQEVTP